MKKALIVKEPFMGREVGQLEELGEASVIDSVNNRFLSQMEKVDVPDYLESMPVKTYKPSDSDITEFWFKDGEILTTDPEDVSWGHHPAVEILGFGLTLDVTKYKADEIIKLYENLQAEVYAEMKVVFGTNKSDSASADEATYRLWAEDPAFYSGQSFFAKADSASYAKGAILNDESDILAYANEMLSEIKSYALWRKQKERDFSIKKASIENS